MSFFFHTGPAPFGRVRQVCFFPGIFGGTGAVGTVSTGGVGTVPTVVTVGAMDTGAVVVPWGGTETHRATVETLPAFTGSGPQTAEKITGALTGTPGRETGTIAWPENETRPFAKTVPLVSVTFQSAM